VTWLAEAGNSDLQGIVALMEGLRLVTLNTKYCFRSGLMERRLRKQSALSDLGWWEDDFEDEALVQIWFGEVIARRRSSRREKMERRQLRRGSIHSHLVCWGDNFGGKVLAQIWFGGEMTSTKRLTARDNFGDPHHSQIWFSSLTNSREWVLELHPSNLSGLRGQTHENGLLRPLDLNETAREGDV